MLWLLANPHLNKHNGQLLGLRIAATEEEREDASPCPPRHAVEIPGPTGCYDLFSAAWCGGLLSQTCERRPPRSAPALGPRARPPRSAPERSRVRRRPAPLRSALGEPGAPHLRGPRRLLPVSQGSIALTCSIIRDTLCPFSQCQSAVEQGPGNIGVNALETAELAALVVAAALTGRRQSLSSSFKGLQVCLGPHEQSTARLEHLPRGQRAGGRLMPAPGAHLAAEAALRERTAPSSGAAAPRGRPLAKQV
ncbi:unnamed protein product [Boreogadus saida]